MPEAQLEHAVPANHRPIYYGGLMRCCLVTIRDTRALTRPGDLLQCRYCFSFCVVNRDGRWEWMAD